MACAHRSPEENRTAACLRRVKPAVKRRSPAHPRPGIVPLPHPRLRLYILHAAQRDTVSGRKRSKPGYDTARRITQCLIARTAVLRGTAHQIAFGFSKITPRLRIPHPGATEQGGIVFGAGEHLFDLGARGDMPARRTNPLHRGAGCSRRTAQGRCEAVKQPPFRDIFGVVRSRRTCLLYTSPSPRDTR